MTLNGILPLPKHAFCLRDSQNGPQFHFLPVSPPGISAGVVLGRFDYWFCDVFGVDGFSGADCLGGGSHHLHAGQ